MNMMLRHVLPLLELDILKTFVAIAETGNFTTAAETVYRTPSAVSMQIKKLEEMLGCVLFLRDARSVSLTPKGEVLLGFARRMLALNNEAVSRFLLPDMNGVVRVGAPEDIGERILPEVLKRFSESYPNVTVDVTIGTSSVMRKRVDEHRMDIAIFNSMAGENTGGGEILVSERARLGRHQMRNGAYARTAADLDVGGWLRLARRCGGAVDPVRPQVPRRLPQRPYDRPARRHPGGSRDRAAAALSRPGRSRGARRGRRGCRSLAITILACRSWTMPRRRFWPWPNTYAPPSSGCNRSGQGGA